MPAQIGWGTLEKLMYQIQKQIKKSAQSGIANTTTTTTTQP